MRTSEESQFEAHLEAHDHALPSMMSAQVTLSVNAGDKCSKLIIPTSNHQPRMTTARSASTSNATTTTAYPLTPQKKNDVDAEKSSWTRVSDKLKRGSTLFARLSAAKKDEETASWELTTPTKSRSSISDAAPQIPPPNFMKSSVGSPDSSSDQADGLPYKYANNALQHSQDQYDEDTNEGGFAIVSNVPGISTLTVEHVDGNEQPETAETARGRESWVTESSYSEDARYPRSNGGDIRYSDAFDLETEGVDYSHDVFDYSTMGQSHFENGTLQHASRDAAFSSGVGQEGSTLNHIYQEYGHLGDREGTQTSFESSTSNLSVESARPYNAGDSAEAARMTGDNRFSQFNFDLEENQDDRGVDIQHSHNLHQVGQRLATSQISRQQPGNAPNVPLPERPESPNSPALCHFPTPTWEHSLSRSYGDTRQLLSESTPLAAPGIAGVESADSSSRSGDDTASDNLRGPGLGIRAIPGRSDVTRISIFTEELGEDEHVSASADGTPVQSEVPLQSSPVGIPAMWMNRRSPMASRAHTPPINSAELYTSRDEDASNIGQSLHLRKKTAIPPSDSWCTVEESSDAIVNQCVPKDQTQSLRVVNTHSAIHISQAYNKNGLQMTTEAMAQDTPTAPSGGPANSRKLRLMEVSSPRHSGLYSDVAADTPYHHPGMIDLNLLSPDPNDDIAYERATASTEAAILEAEHEHLLSSSPPPPIPPRPSFGKFAQIGPKANLTGTPLGTNMRDAGSSVAPSSSPLNEGFISAQDSDRRYRADLKSSQSLDNVSPSSGRAGRERLRASTLMQQLSPPQPVYSPDRDGSTTNASHASRDFHLIAPFAERQYGEGIEMTHFRPGQRLYSTPYPPMHQGGSRTTVISHNSRRSDVHGLRHHDSFHSYTPLTHVMIHGAGTVTPDFRRPRPRTFSGSSPRQLELARRHQFEIHNDDLHRKQVQISWVLFGISCIAGPITLPAFGLGGMDKLLDLVTGGAIQEVDADKKKMWAPALLVWVLLFVLMVVVVGFETGAIHSAH